MAKLKYYTYQSVCVNIIEGSLEVKLPTIWTDESRDGKSQRREGKKKENQRRDSRKKEDPGARKGGKVAKHCVFAMICGSSRSAKGAGAEQSGQMRDEKLHAIAAPSTFASENAKNTSRLEHFWKLRCRKSARRFGAKHIWKSKCQNEPGSDHFWKLTCQKSLRRLWRESNFKVKSIKKLTAASRHFWKLTCRKKCMPLWREAHVQAKKQQHNMPVPLLKVQMWFCGAGARDCARCQK